ncbi:hypothetical protein BJY01DRAFT_240782 [Aspergillus pseudoustus]|uniref:Uncharacterized protein n=1 Tax=Aspergillus pseudoustus TaxID=1810923 RepID=A0ABR4IN63_9EURO
MKLHNFSFRFNAKELYRRCLLFHYYRIFNGHLNEPRLETLRDPILFPHQHLVDRAGRQWTGNLLTLKGALIRMAEYWPRLPDTAGTPCPVQFSDSEGAGFSEQEKLLFALNSAVNPWRDRVGGVSEDGWISHDRYDDALIATAAGDEEDIRLLENRGAVQGSR